MGHVVYRIAPAEAGYCIEIDGKKTGSYLTREAAFEAVVLPASHSIKDGDDVTIEIPRSGVRAN